MSLALYAIAFGLSAFLFLVVRSKIKRIPYDTKAVLAISISCIEQSPRFQNHIVSLLNSGFSVDVVALQDDTGTTSEFIARMGRNCRFHGVKSFSNTKSKLIFQTIQFVWILLKIKLPFAILICVPPSLPIIAIAACYSQIFSIRFLVDWHNFSWAVLQKKKTPKSLILLLKPVELYFAKFASINLVVTCRMKKYLSKYSTKVIEFYDRPNDQFHPISQESKKEYRYKLARRLGIEFNEHRLIISATSWTIDEDFNILLEALKLYEKEAQIPLHIIVSGQGPLKAEYEAKFKAACLTQSTFNTIWVSQNEYPLFIASADIGISLHTGHEGMDFPMKVLDMFGCGVPVIAYDFEAAHEIIEDNFNAILFNDHHSLYQAIKALLNDKRLYYKLATASAKAGELRWKEAWSQQVENIFKLPVDSSIKGMHWYKSE